jgi:hypothetical protein
MNKDAEIKDGKVQEDALSQIGSSGFAVAIGGNSRLLRYVNLWGRSDSFTT